MNPPAATRSRLLLVVLAGLVALAGGTAPAAAEPRPSARPQRARARPDSQARVALLFARARLAAAERRHAEVVRLLGQLLTLRPRHLPARHLRGLSHVALEHWHLAERDLTAVSWKRPRDGALGRLIARVQVAQKKFMWAARRYKRLLALEPRAGELELGFGYCLYRLGEIEEASKALGRARRLGPRAVANQARVVLALIQRQRGKLRQARLLLADVRGPGAELARTLTSQLFTDAGRAARSLKLTFRLGTRYDSNVSMDPVDRRGSGSEGWLWNLGAALSWQALSSGRHRLGVGLGLQRSFALNFWEQGSCVSDYSMLVGVISPYWGLHFATGRVDHELRLSYRGQVITLDGDCSEDAALFAFTEEHAGSLGWKLSWSEQTATHLLVDLGYGLFHQLVRDRLATEVQLGQSIFLAGRRVKLYPELSFRHEQARGEHWSFDAVGAALAFSSLLPGKVDLLASVDYQFQRYPHSGGYVFWGLATDEPRQDHILRLALSVGRRLTSWLRADVAYRYRLNRSNAGPYDYDRHVVDLTFTAQLELLGQGKKKRRKTP